MTASLHELVTGNRKAARRRALLERVETAKALAYSLVEDDRANKFEWAAIGGFLSEIEAKARRLGDE